MPVGRLKHELPEAEFREYAAYYARVPTVVEVLDLWGSRLLSAAISLWSTERATAAEFDPDRWGDSARQHRATFVDRLVAWASAASLAGGADGTRGERR